MLYALIVIYNKNCNDSQTLNSLKKYSDRIKIIIFDNSTSDYNNCEYCKKNNYDYYTFDKNLGLSRAYNFVIDKIKKDENHYLIILDDDTELSDEYFEEMFNETKRCEYDIILPVVRTQKIILSPSNVKFECRVKNIKNIEYIDFDNITAINSGMIVKTNVYNSVKYNEDMFLDYVDHDFMRNVRNNNFKIHIMKTEIFQNFSREEKTTYEKARFRFNIYKKDFKVYCKECNNLLFYYLSLFKFKILNLKKYKKIF